MTAKPGTPPGRQCFRQYARNKTLRHRTRRNIPEASPLRTPRADAAARPALSSPALSGRPLPYRTMRHAPVPNDAAASCASKTEKSPAAYCRGAPFLQKVRAAAGKRLRRGKRFAVTGTTRRVAAPPPPLSLSMPGGTAPADAFGSSLPDAPSEGNGFAKAPQRLPPFCRTERLLRQLLQNREFSCSKAFW